MTLVYYFTYTDLLTISLVVCMVLSLFLNGLQLYYFSVIKKKITVDYIKAQIFVVNIVFTVIAMPYYILKENQFLNLNSCKILYFLSDFIMFVYNNLLILMAIDRFLFICTRYRYNMKRWFITFYTVTTIIGLTSISRLFFRDCQNFIVIESFILIQQSFRSYETFNKFLDDNIIIIYNFFILFVIAVNWILTVLIYMFIIIYVYKNSVDKSKVLKQRTRSQDKSFKIKETIELFNIRNKINYNKYARDVKTQPSPKLLIASSRFKSSKHWRITIVFIKVNSNYISS
jgi:hypothetical protein